MLVIRIDVKYGDDITVAYHRLKLTVCKSPSVGCDVMLFWQTLNVTNVQAVD